ncbi:MAG: DUF2079 domain-containing protein [Chloroflexi bacterium]|nr:DUF2079 domain-containing protein [Chloroflexota bacterium]
MASLVDRSAHPRAAATSSVLPVLSGLMFLAVSAFFALAQHATFHTRARDMGIYVQALWSAAQGRPFLTSLLQSNTNHLAEHVAPVMWPLVPLVGLWSDAYPLLLIQQILLSASGIPVYLLARKRLGAWPALLVLASFYLMPAISRVSLSEFHPVVLAALPVAAGVAALLDGRRHLGALLLLLALLFEEEAAPLVAGAGLMLLLYDLFKRQRVVDRGTPRTAARDRQDGVLPIGLIVLGTLWVLLAAFAVMPGFRAPEAAREASNRALSHYDLVRQDPAIVMSWLLGERGPDAAASLLLPVGGVALLAPVSLVAAAPTFMLLFLQDRAGSYAGHWAAPMLPVLWLATVIGLGWLARWRRIERMGLVALALGTAVAYPLDSFFPGGREWEPDNVSFAAVDRQLAEAARLVPPGSSVVATRRAVPHLADRRESYQFPSSFYSAPFRFESNRQDVYLLDLTDSFTRRALAPNEADSVLEKRPRYGVRRFGDSVLLLTRAQPKPSEAPSALFGGAVRLLGVDPPSGGWQAWQCGSPLSFWLYWDSVRRPDVEPIRLVRLTRQDGSALDEWRGQPLDDYLTVRQWERNQVIAERVTLLDGATPAASSRAATGGSCAGGVLGLEVGWLGAASAPLTTGEGEPMLELARWSSTASGR